MPGGRLLVVADPGHAIEGLAPLLAAAPPATVTAVLADGRREHVFVEHAIGSLERPLSDAQLEGKFRAMADPVIGAARGAALVTACRDLANAPSVGVIVGQARP